MSVKEVEVFEFCYVFLELWIASKRLLHLTGYAQKLLHKKDQVLHHLIEMQVDGPEDRVKARRMIRLLQRIKGIPVCGYFSFDRSILPVLLGNMLTYAIILMEFQVGDSSGD